MYIGAIIGEWLFAGRLKFVDNEFGYSENGVIPRSNFDNLTWSFTTVFHVITGDHWNNVKFIIIIKGLGQI